jgi:hypothetical protein
MHSITLTSTLLFLPKTSRIGENTFDLLHLTLMFPNVNGVVGLFTIVTIDGEFKITIFG